MDFFTALIIIWLIGAAIIVIVIKGRKALAVFADLKQEDIIFRDQSASGSANNKTFSSPLDVILTNKELCLSSPFIFAALGKSIDVIHRISREQIQSVNDTEKGILLSFKTQEGQDKQVRIVLKDKVAFLKLLAPQ